MPRRNRVTPVGELIADPARGLVFGNRGCLHDADGEIRRGYATAAGSAAGSVPGRRRSPLQQPGRYTELFFLDEATAFAAGHRPCALCRRADYGASWRGAAARGADDARRSPSRRAARRPSAADPPVRHAELPDGAFVLEDDGRGSSTATRCSAGRRPATRTARRGRMAPQRYSRRRP